MMIFMPTICFAKVKPDSITVLEKVWSYKRNFAQKKEGGSMNAYLRYTIDTKRRNFILFTVPTLYTIAQGDRQNISEIYGRMEKLGEHHFRLRPQITSNTIYHNNQVSEAFTEYVTPSIYDITIYNEKILSPFHRFNKIYYRYTVEHDGTNQARISFRPKLKNTQLVKGTAVVDVNTGRVISTVFDGEFNMVDFHVESTKLMTNRTSSATSYHCFFFNTLRKAHNPS